jgi:hypothetical protein
MADQVLERLLTRYPDRSLVIAADLLDPKARLVARRTLERVDASLFALHPRPIAETLSCVDPNGSNRADRSDLLWLLARAQRHISLPDEGGLARWMAERAHIHWHLESTSEPWPKQAKVISPPSFGSTPVWNFEY